MQLVQQLQESLLPFIMYKLRFINIRTHYFAINTGTENACVNEHTLLRGEVEKSKDEYLVLHVISLLYAKLLCDLFARWTLNCSFDLIYFCSLVNTRHHVYQSLAYRELSHEGEMFIKLLEQMNKEKLVN